jgi:hypothetical protein
VVIQGVPVCGANFVSPVTHTTSFINEVHYRIGIRCRLEIKDNNQIKEETIDLELENIAGNLVIAEYQWKDFGLD